MKNKKINYIRNILKSFHGESSYVHSFNKHNTIYTIEEAINKSFKKPDDFILFLRKNWNNVIQDEDLYNNSRIVKFVFLTLIIEFDNTVILAELKSKKDTIIEKYNLLLEKKFNRKIYNIRFIPFGGNLINS